MKQKLFLSLILIVFNAACSKPQGASISSNGNSGFYLSAEGAESFGYEAAETSSCEPQQKFMVRKDLQVCVFVSDLCEENYLKEMGFENDDPAICQEARKTSSVKTWVEVRASSEGVACTQQYALLVHEELNLCLEATNGCEIHAAQGLHFTFDTQGICSERI